MSNEENQRDLEESFMMNASTMMGGKGGGLKQAKSNPAFGSNKAFAGDSNDVGIWDYNQLK